MPGTPPEILPVPPASSSLTPNHGPSPKQVAHSEGTTTRMAPTKGHRKTFFLVGRFIMLLFFFF